MRFLKRMLIWWRWPMAVAAAILVGAIVVGGWYDIGFNICFAQAGRWTGLGARTVSGTLYLHWDTLYPTISPGDSDCWVKPASVPWYWNWWCFYLQGSDGITQGIADHIFLVFSIWTLALPMSAMGWIGFLAKRRQPTLDLCRACHHPLMGAATCPECGRAASAS